LQPANKEAECSLKVLERRFKPKKKFKINSEKAKKVYTFAARKRGKESVVKHEETSETGTQK
jgi:Holliday junction resolvase